MGNRERRLEALEAAMREKANSGIMPRSYLVIHDPAKPKPDLEKLGITTEDRVVLLPHNGRDDPGGPLPHVICLSPYHQP